MLFRQMYFNDHAKWAYHYCLKEQLRLKKIFFLPDENLHFYFYFLYSQLFRNAWLSLLLQIDILIDYFWCIFSVPSLCKSFII